MSGMSIDILTSLVHLAPALVQASSEDGALWLLAAGPAGGVATYWAFYRYYRNTDKSHAYERDTIIEAQPVQGGEDKVDHISKTRSSGISGDNGDKYRDRVQRLT